MNMDEILQMVADKNGVSVDEIIKEIQKMLRVIQSQHSQQLSVTKSQM